MLHRHSEPTKLRGTANIKMLTVHKFTMQLANLELKLKLCVINRRILNNQLFSMTIKMIIKNNNTV